MTSKRTVPGPLRGVPRACVIRERLRTIHTEQRGLVQLLRVAEAIETASSDDDDIVIAEASAPEASEAAK